MQFSSDAIHLKAQLNVLEIVLRDPVCLSDEEMKHDDFGDLRDACIARTPSVWEIHGSCFTSLHLRNSMERGRIC